MTLLAIILAAATLFLSGTLYGYVVGRRDGYEDAYEEVERYYRHR